MGGISEKAISERAYHIWQREGCPHGRDFEHWVQAQVELEAEAHRGAGNGAAKPVAPRASAKPKAPSAAKPARVAKPKAAARPKKA